MNWKKITALLGIGFSIIILIRSLISAFMVVFSGSRGSFSFGYLIGDFLIIFVAGSLIFYLIDWAFIKNKKPRPRIYK